MKYNCLILSCLILLLKSELYDASKIPRYGLATAGPSVKNEANIDTKKAINKAVAEKANITTATARTEQTFKTNKINASSVLRMVRNENTRPNSKLTRGLRIIEELSKMANPDPSKMARTGELQKIGVKKNEMDSIIDNIFRDMNEKGVNPTELDEDEFKNAMGKALIEMGDNTREMKEYIHGIDENTSLTNENMKEMENTRETVEMAEDLSNIDIGELDKIEIIDESRDKYNPNTKPNPTRTSQDLKQDKTKYLNEIRQHIKTATNNMKNTMPNKNPIRQSGNPNVMGKWSDKKPIIPRERPKNNGKTNGIIKIELNDNIKRLERYFQGRDDLQYDIDPNDPLNIDLH